MALKWKNLDETASYTRLRQTDTLVSLSDDLTADRVRTWNVPAGSGLMFHYGASMVTGTDLDRLQALADEQQLIEKYKAVLNGELWYSRRILKEHRCGQWP